VDATIAASATALGGDCAVIRLSGPAAFAIAARAGLPVPAPWLAVAAGWPLAAGRCPCRLLAARAPRSFTGFDVLEITLPGSRDVVELALSQLRSCGAEQAEPGGFARQALANGRLSLVAAEAILAICQAPSAAAAAQAVERLRGGLAHEIAGVRQRLLELRAVVEAGLDFLDEADVRAYDPSQLTRELGALHAILARWMVAADDLEAEPRVCLVGPANAGKSALFNRLAGAAAPPALVSAQAGTTRDWLEARWRIGDRTVRLVDTAGWLESGLAHGDLDRSAVRAGAAASSGAALLLACSAPDARLGADHGLDIERTLVIATKCDLGQPDPRAVLAVSAASGAGCAQLCGLVASRLGAVSGGEPRQQRLLASAAALLERLSASLPGDELLAEDLRAAVDQLGELIGVTTPDEVLGAIFARFCIGK
jgi:tRNA modification GTPase